MAVLQDIFDGDMKETLKDLYRTKVWSEIGEEVKIKLLNGLRNNLVACHLKVPTDKELLNRLKGFYRTRRYTIMTKEDAEKNRKRKLSMKASRRTFAERERIVMKAVEEKKLDPSNRDDIEALRKSVPKIPLDSISPPHSDDEHAHESNLLKRLHHLEKARETKRKKRSKELNELSTGRSKVPEVQRKNYSPPLFSGGRIRSTAGKLFTSPILR